MAVAVIQDWVEEETDRSTKNYDAINSRLREGGGGPMPEGFVLHAAGFTGDGFRIIEIWESREQFESFVQEKVMPIVAEVAGDDDREPAVTVYELHNLVTA